MRETTRTGRSLFTPPLSPHGVCLPTVLTRHRVSCDFDPFDMDFDGYVDGIHFLGFEYLEGHVLGCHEFEGDYQQSEVGYDE